MSIAHSLQSNTATFTLDHYEHMVNCGAFGYGFEMPVELLRGKILNKHTGAPAKYSLDHYEHMVAVGAFDEPYNIKAELLHGEIVMMSPIGYLHSDIVTILTEWSYDVVPRAEIRILSQNPIRIPCDDSEPEPDLAWFKRRDKALHHPEPNDVLLVIEVAETSLEKDRTKKLAIYAEARIAEYWIVNLVDKQIEVYRDPSGLSYGQKSIFQGNDVIHPLALPKAKLAPSQLFRKE